MFEIVIMPPAEHVIKKLSNKEQTRHLAGIEKLRKRPRLGKKLVGKLTGLRSLRTSRYRVIYEIKESELVVLVLKAGNMRDMYSKKPSRN